MEYKAWWSGEDRREYTLDRNSFESCEAWIIKRKASQGSGKKATAIVLRNRAVAVAVDVAVAVAVAGTALRLNRLATALRLAAPLR